MIISEKDDSPLRIEHMVEASTELVLQLEIADRDDVCPPVISYGFGPEPTVLEACQCRLGDPAAVLQFQQRPPKFGSAPYKALNGEQPNAEW